MQFFLHDSDQHVHRKGDPYLGEHRVFRCSVECFDSQVLFEPPEEEFHLPATTIQFGHGHGRNRETVGQEGKALVSGSTNLTKRSLSG